MAHLNPNSLFIFSGSNLNFINAVKFGDLVVGDLSYMGSTGISGLVPEAAYTTDVRLVTSFGPRGTAGYSVGSPFVVLRQADQIDVGPLPSVSGKAGDIINITGENFYQLTTVKFGEVSGEFNTVDSQTVEVKVPLNADYAKITAFSSLRTGLANDQTIASGLSSDEFVPIPEVSGRSSSQLVSGSTLTVTGFSFKGVTGINFNNIITGATVVDANSITAVVPSGNTRGVPSLLLQSGGVSSFPSTLPFNPLADVTGVGGAVGTTRTGDLVYLSGDNFSTGILYKTGSNYLGTIMGQTGEFELITDKVMSGLVPSGIPIIASSGNLGAGIDPVISSGLVSLFSDRYPETYPSETYFTPQIGPPSVSSITPASGIAGDVLAVKGSDLYSVTGVNLLPSDSANVGIGTYQAGTLSEAIPGSQVNFEIGNAASIGALGEYYDVVLSGFFGAATGVSGFFSLGTPSISSNTPSTNIVPGVTGLIEGSRLYSGTTVELYTGEASVGSFQSYLTLPSSGYTSAYDQIEYTYPNSFLTGINYRMIVRNRRSFDGVTDPNLGVLRSPHFSGFEPLSGEFGETITVSGYFENMRTSGLKVGSTIVNTFNQPGTTGFTFQIPETSRSDVINVSTSGGGVSSAGILEVYLSKPSISGFYGGLTSPAAIDYDQVFAVGDNLTVSGERLDLVTGVSFSGELGAVEINDFSNQGYDMLTLSLPKINPDSGFFEVTDFKGRTSVSNTGINFNTVSGFVNNLLPGETMTLSGRNVSGMNVLFPSATGNNEFVSSANLSNSINAENVESITVNTPTGIVFGDLKITGRQNTIGVEGEAFVPVGVITGVSGFDANRIIPTGSYFFVTGINCFDSNLASMGETFFSGIEGVVGLSGSGMLKSRMNGSTISPLTLQEYTTGTATIGGASNVFYSQVRVAAPKFLMSGSLFTVDPWMTSSGAVSEMNLEKSYKNTDIFWNYGPPLNYNSTKNSAILTKKISSFPDTYSVTGENITFSGFSPVRQIVGGEIQISGENLNLVDRVQLKPILSNVVAGQVGLSGASGAALNSARLESFDASFFHSGNSGIWASIPESFPRGMAKISLHGPPVGAILTTFSGTESGIGSTKVEVLLNTSTVKYDIIKSGDAAPSDASRSMNYTIEEDIGGTIFLVTRTKFPDGTSAVISSVPKP